MFNIQRENAIAFFTSYKLDKSDEIDEVVNNLAINDAEYYESNTATAIDAQGDFTCYPETVTNTINSNETGTHNRNGDFEKKY